MGTIEMDKTKHTRMGGLHNFRSEYSVEIMMFLVFLLLCALISVLTPRFLSAGNIRNLFWQATTVGIIAIGQTLIILTAGIDLSVGGIMAISAMLGGLVMSNTSLGAGITTVLLTGLGVGVLNGVLVSYARLAPFIVTLGTLSITQSLTYVITDGSSITGLPAGYRFFGYQRVFGLPLYTIVLIGLFILGHIMLKKTKLGRFLYAIGSNEEASRLAGVNVKFNKMIAYSITGLLCAIAALILTSRLGAIDPDTGSGIELDTIAAVVIGGASMSGGKGSLVGTLIGVFFITVLHNGLNLIGVSPFWQGSAVGAVIIISVLLDSMLRSR
ncbi:MAG: ABC transporter permease [Spirochaetae bacterium HGW-Spirochaetae-4]|nr:MAG: ABC transporter permease [Spirochaetae bacterium HGW-Spirochaetae-4]HCG62927.1 ABC transporter permease [Sphaerochaeta sp.]HCS37742.1 ABC transporter permease [Sphaerochaeta sp.]